MFTVKKVRFWAICSILFYSRFVQAITEVSIQAEHLEHPLVKAKSVTINLDLIHSLASISAKTLAKQKMENDWAQFDLACSLPENIQNGHWSCPQGSYKAARMSIPFSIEMHHLMTDGSLDLNANVQINNASFNDVSGLHAGEKCTGRIAVTVKQIGSQWDWSTAIDWNSGEVFWDPFYIANGGYQFTADGRFENNVVTFDHGHLKIDKAGGLNFKAQWHLGDNQLTRFTGDLANLDLKEAYPLILKPIFDKTALGNAEMSGAADLKFEIKNAELKSFELGLKNVNIVDLNQKFAFYKVYAMLPWSYDEPKSITFGYGGGKLLNLPLGEASINAEVNRFAVTSPGIMLPILDGALDLTDISAAFIDSKWYWHLTAKLSPISMIDFSHSLNLPSMLGKASAEIPLATYSDGILTTDGSVVLNIFNGQAKVTQLRLLYPLSKAPKLNANILLRNLDLGELTRTFSFGAIEGKLDGDIIDLEMINWKPVKFDAKVQNSSGQYPKKISQRAVENISSLGGASAAAALQRSFLRFFSQFNYGKLALSCRLRNDVCQMGGLESTQGGYTIVKGSGIPAITVLGYNKNISWGELLSRIKRVTDTNTQAIIK